jgi:hypothetical protein
MCNTILNLSDLKVAAMDARNDTTVTVEQAVTSMGMSILKALPTAPAIILKEKAKRNDDFESFATNRSRVFQPTATFFQLSN